MKGGRKPANQLDNCSAKDAWKELTGKDIGYLGGKDEMDEDVYSEFITKTMGLAEDSLLQFYFMTIGMNTPKLGHIKFDNFNHLFVFQGK